MPLMRVKSSNVEDGAVWREDLNVATPGKAVVRRVLVGPGLTSTWTGIDVGTGDVTMSLAKNIDVDAGQTQRIAAGDSELGISNIGDYGSLYFRSNSMGGDFSPIEMTLNAEEGFQISQGSGALQLNDGYLGFSVGSNYLSITTAGITLSGDILANPKIKGIQGFDANGEMASLFFGDTNNYIRAKYGTGVQIGVAGKPDALSIGNNTGDCEFKGALTLVNGSKIADTYDLNIYTTQAGKNVNIQSRNQFYIGRYSDNASLFSVRDSDGLATFGGRIAVPANVGLTSSPSTNYDAIPYAIYGDKLRWKAPYATERWNGSSWVSWNSLLGGSWADLTDGKGETGAVIPNSIFNSGGKLRITYDIGLQWSSISALRLMQEYHQRPYAITVEQSNDLSSWMIVINNRSLPENMQNIVFMDDRGEIYQQYVRITFTPNQTGVVTDWALNGIEGITYRPGNQGGAGLDKLLPLTWDNTGKITVKNFLTVPDNAEFNSVVYIRGTAQAWSSIGLYKSDWSRGAFVQYDHIGNSLRLQTTEDAGVVWSLRTFQIGEYGHNDGTITFFPSGGGSYFHIKNTNDNYLRISSGSTPGSGPLVDIGLTEFKYKAATGNDALVNLVGGSWSSGRKVILRFGDGTSDLNSITVAWGGGMTLKAAESLYLQPQGGSSQIEASRSINVATGYGYKVNGTQVIGARTTGWTAASGTATRTSFATSSVTTSQLAERVKALIEDLMTHGVIGT